MEDEFTLRCDKAIVDLNKIAREYLDKFNILEYNRVMGKIEGVSLAESYYRALQQLKENIK